MIKLITRKQLGNIDVPEHIEYIYLLDDKGYGYIDLGTDNEIKLFIKEEYRGQGLGTELFSRIYKDIDKEIIEFNLSKSIIDEYKVIRIITNHYNAKDVTTINNVTKYIIRKEV